MNKEQHDEIIQRDGIDIAKLRWNVLKIIVVFYFSFQNNVKPISFLSMLDIVNGWIEHQWPIHLLKKSNSIVVMVGPMIYDGNAHQPIYFLKLMGNNQ